MENKSDLEAKAAINGQSLNEKNAYKDIESDLNLKILQVTMRIKDHYPELSKFLDEIPVTIPDENDMDISLKNLESYYDSLNAILNKYISEHPEELKQ